MTMTRSETALPQKAERYLFDPETLHGIARRAVGQTHDEMCKTICDGLATAYPGYIDTEQEWIFSCAGGAVGVMKVLHASLSEYVIIFGSAIGTEGFSGRYRIGIHDFLTAGECWTYTDDNVGQRVVSKAGDHLYLSPERVKGFRILENTWMLEYGRGPIPTALPFALADAIFSMLDGETLWKTLWIYGRLVTRNLLKGKV